MKDIAYLLAAEAWYAARGLTPEIQRRRKAQRLLYRQFLAPGDLCFDVGANIGDRTRAFLDLGARVVAIDPQPSCVRRLSFVFGRNARVKIVAAGLGAEPGEADLAICDAAPTISTMSPQFRESGRFSDSYQWSRTVRVPVTTLDALIDSYGSPAFCKIDVEGFELNVLRGLSRPVSALSFEFASDSLDDTSACLERICELGDPHLNYSLGENMEWALPEWVTPPTLLAHLTTTYANGPLIGGDVYVRLTPR